jgi:glutamyl-Q tRNA(Asp) synthetase
VINHQSLKGRFAPSPTGPLHLGSLVAALASYLLVKQQLGKWIIRIEDLDPPREKKGMAEQQIKTLQQFGLVSDEVIVWQSQRSPLYEAAINRLLLENKAFYCSCSRKQLQQQNGIHRFCQTPVNNQQSSIRLRMPDLDISFEDAIYGVQMQNLGRDVGDMVLKRADGYFAYQLAVVVDDAAQEISQIVRGADLLDSTLRQIYLQKQLRYSTPDYVHIPLVLDVSGQKLSKSLWAKALDEEDRFTAFQSAYQHLGQNIEVLDRRQNAEKRLQVALQHFDATRIEAVKACVSHESQ